MVDIRKLFLLGMVLAVLISNIGLGMAAQGDVVANDLVDNAANSGGDSGMKLTTSTFTQGMSWSQISPLMPIAVMILLFLAFIYGLSCFSAIFASGTKVNIGSILKSNDLRNEGQKGFLSIIGGAILMAVSFILIFIIWNNYGLGAW